MYRYIDTSELKGKNIYCTAFYSRYCIISTTTMEFSIIGIVKCEDGYDELTHLNYVDSDWLVRNIPAGILVSTGVMLSDEYFNIQSVIQSKKQIEIDNKEANEYLRLKMKFEGK